MHGDSAGLKSVASACEALLRRSDLFSGQGGEGFAILLGHIGMNGALATTERLQTIIQNLALELSPGGLKVRASFEIS